MSDILKFNEIVKSRYKTMVNQFLPKMMEEKVELFSRKNADYGSSFREAGIVGIVVRLGDKLKRLQQVGRDGYDIKVKEEGLRELFNDIANYCEMGLMMMDEYPGKEEHRVEWTKPQIGSIEYNAYAGTEDLEKDTNSLSFEEVWNLPDADLGPWVDTPGSVVKVTPPSLLQRLRGDYDIKYDVFCQDCGNFHQVDEGCGA